MKKCLSCKEEKDFKDFYKDSTKPDNYTNRCRVCMKAYYKAYSASRKAAQPRFEVQSKVCRDCGLEKPIGQFGKKSTSLDKHNIYCKPCWRNRTYAAIRKQNGR